jgi:signal transduction histidine kinase
MKVRLVSKDSALYRVCREALLSLPDRQWDFAALPSWEPDLEAEVWIWDGESEMPPESWFQEERRIIFITDRKKIERIRDHWPIQVARVLLKPVRPRLLQESLQQMLPEVSPRSSTMESDPNANRLMHERDQLLQHLLEANLKLQEYEQERSDFLARTAHELRAPLVAMSGYCGMLLDQQFGSLNPDQQNALEKMQHSARRMTRLANGMLQISMGRDLEFEASMKVGDIQKLIDQVIAEVKPIADSKRLQLQKDVTLPPQPLLYEPWQIEQVLVNLLDNACRLTPRGGVIQVRAFPTFWDWRSSNVTEPSFTEERRSTDIRKPNAYRVEVRDSGSGFHELRAGVSRDSRISSSTPTSGGPVRAGLGLAICRQIIAAHKGRVITESGPHGATLSFLLPFVQKKAVRPIPVGTTRQHSAAAARG